MTNADGAGGVAAGSGRRLRKVAGRDIAFDAEGFFWEFEDWDERAAEELAAESGLENMEEPHWKLLRFFREFYAYNARAPLNRDLKKGTGMSLMELQGLFPGGLKDGARRLAVCLIPKPATRRALPKTNLK